MFVQGTTTMVHDVSFACEPVMKAAHMMQKLGLLVVTFSKSPITSSNSSSEMTMGWITSGSSRGSLRCAGRPSLLCRILKQPLELKSPRHELPHCSCRATLCRAHPLIRKIMSECALRGFLDRRGPPDTTPSMGTHDPRGPIESL